MVFRFIRASYKWKNGQKGGWQAAIPLCCTIQKNLNALPAGTVLGVHDLDALSLQLIADAVGLRDSVLEGTYDKEKFLQQMGNDLNTSMGVTALYDALKAKTNDATKLAILDSYDQVLSLSLLEKAAAMREANAKAQTAKAEGGYTVTGEGDPAIDALVIPAAFFI